MCNVDINLSIESKFFVVKTEGRKISERQSNSKNENKLTTPWLKMKKTNRQTIVHTTQHRKLKNKQHEPN